jgi:hypothetical protein
MFSTPFFFIQLPLQEELATQKYTATQLSPERTAMILLMIARKKNREIVRILIFIDLTFIAYTELAQCIV